MFAKRVASSAVLIAVAVLSVWFSHGPWAILSYGVAALLAIAALEEYYGLLAARGMRPWTRSGGAAAAVYLAAVFVDCAAPGMLPRPVEHAAAGAILAWLLARLAFERDARVALPAFAGVVSGLVYIAGPWSFIFRILYHPPADGRWLIFALFLIVKGGDILAYLVGKAVGRHKLIPRVSPGKTWEGAAANLAGGVAGGVAAWGLFPCGLTLPRALLLGAVLSAAGQAGDLAESAMKRGAGVKDSGGFIPGMGGILDVVDSLLLALPAMYILTPGAW